MRSASRLLKAAMIASMCAIVTPACPSEGSSLAILFHSSD